MSSRKRPGGAVDSRPAQKQSRLLPSSAGGTSQTEPADLEESATPAFEPAGGESIDFTGDLSESEVIAVIIDESFEDRQQSQQQPHLSRASENSAEPLARNDEEEPREDDGAWPAGPASPLMSKGDNSQVQDKDQNQQYPLGSGDTENTAELRESDSEEEPRYNNDAWTAHLVSPTSEDDNTEIQQDSLDSRAAENAAELLVNENEEESQNMEMPSASLLCVICRSCYLELFEVYQQQKRATLNRNEQADGSGNGTGANDAPVAGSAPAEQGAAEEGAALSNAQQGVVIRCPVCMDSYSEIVQSGRLILATICGHIFCSECLPVALETTGMCPTCRVELTPDLYYPIYI